MATAFAYRAVAGLLCMHAPPCFLLLPNEFQTGQNCWGPLRSSHQPRCLVCSAVADFISSFGGGPIVQAAWELTGLPPLGAGGSLTGTDDHPDLEDYSQLRPSPTIEATAPATNWQSPQWSPPENHQCTIVFREYGLGPLL